MASHMTVTVEFENKPIATLRKAVDKQNKGPAVRAVAAELGGVLNGARKAKVRTVLASACASGTLTCDQSATVNDTDVATIGGVALAVKASPSTTAQFAKGAGNTAMAKNLAACINGNATLAKIVRATSSGAVVTITALVPGPVGNYITLAETGNGMTKSGTALENGASDEVDSFQFGYEPTV